MSKFLELSQVDKTILTSYQLAIEGISDYLGSGYEIILHSLENLEHSVIAIKNGKLSGRKIGAPITDLALKMLNDMGDNPKPISYFNKKDGVTLKSATIPIIGENNRVIGLMCLNFYMNMTLENILSEFNIKNESSSQSYIENFNENLNSIIQSTIQKAINSVNSNRNIHASNKNKEIISILYEKGIFNIKESVQYVADYMNLSKNTVYLHIRNIENENI